MFQGSFHDFQGCQNVEEAALIRAIGAQCITLRAKFTDFKDNFQNSRTFQGYSKILNKIQEFQGSALNSRISRIFSRMWQP